MSTSQRWSSLGGQNSMLTKFSMIWTTLALPIRPAAMRTTGLLLQKSSSCDLQIHAPVMKKDRQLQISTKVGRQLTDFSAVKVLSEQGDLQVEGHIGADIRGAGPSSRQQGANDISQSGRSDCKGDKETHGNGWLCGKGSGKGEREERRVGEGSEL